MEVEHNLVLSVYVGSGKAPAPVSVAQLLAYP